MQAQKELSAGDASLNVHSTANVVLSTITTKMIYENITPEKSLYWLSGGYKEWKSLEHYNRPWCDCYLDFQEEFGLLVISIIKRSKTLEDMRKHFIEYLNLPVLYDFALSRKLLR
jgi:hypothetical protein